MKQLLVAAMTVGTVFLAMAAEVRFPYAAGVGDITSPDDWGLEAVPGPADVVIIGTKSQTHTVTATHDAEFGGIKANAEMGEVIFDLRESVSGSARRRIRMNGGAVADQVWMTSLFLRGGVWDFSGSVGIWNGSYVVPKRSRVTIDSGALVTCGGLQGGYGDMATGGFTVAGAGTLVTTKVFKVNYYNGSNNRCYVEDGATVVVNGSGGHGEFQMDSGNASNNVLYVRNGSTLRKITGGANYMGGQGGQHRVVVEGGSTMEISGMTYFGYSDADNANSSSGNCWVVSGTDSRLTLSSVYFGRATSRTNPMETGNSCNTFEARDGGTFTVQVLYIKGHDNGCIVSNGTFVTTGSGLNCDADLSTNCFVRLQGNHPYFEMNSSGGTGNFNLKNGFRIIFDLPAEGYAFDATYTVPFNSPRWGVMDATPMVEVNGIKEMQQRMKADSVSRQTFHLASFPSGFQLPAGMGRADMLAKWNAQMPEGARLAWNGNFIDLTVRSGQGTAIMLR